jgi:hypothetical protein
MSDDLLPVDGHAAAAKSKQPRSSQVRERLMEALAQERLILEQWRQQAPSVFDFGATTRDLWELWRAEVGELRAPPPRPTPRNYQDAANALDLFQRAVDTLPESTPTIWYHGNRSYSLDGQPPITVTEEEDNILTVFVDAESDSSHDTRQLTSESGVTNVARTMKQIAVKFPGTVRMPGRKGKGSGYYVRVRLVDIS